MILSSRYIFNVSFKSKEIIAKISVTANISLKRLGGTQLFTMFKFDFAFLERLSAFIVFYVKFNNVACSLINRFLGYPELYRVARENSG